LSVWARRQAGRRDPHRVLPHRRTSAYAGAAPTAVAANDNPAPLPRRSPSAWIVPFGLVAATVLFLALT